MLINDGHGHFADETSTRLLEPPTQAKSWPQRVLLEDVNDDGRPDLTVQFSPAGVVPEADPTMVYLNTDGVFRRIVAPKDGYASIGGGIGWVNGDGPHALFSVEWLRPNMDRLPTTSHPNTWRYRQRRRASTQRASAKRFVSADRPSRALRDIRCSATER